MEQSNLARSSYRMAVHFVCTLRLRIVEQKLGVHVALAHDTTWMTQEENYAVLHSLLDGDLKERIKRASLD